MVPGIIFRNPTHCYFDHFIVKAVQLHLRLQKVVESCFWIRSLLKKLILAKQHDKYLELWDKYLEQSEQQQINSIFCWVYLYFRRLCMLKKSKDEIRHVKYTQVGTYQMMLTSLKLMKFCFYGCQARRHGVATNTIANGRHRHHVFKNNRENDQNFLLSRILQAVHFQEEPIEIYQW